MGAAGEQDDDASGLRVHGFEQAGQEPCYTPASTAASK
jgi:hypothetical protein